MMRIASPPFCSWLDSIDILMHMVRIMSVLGSSLLVDMFET